MIVLDTLKMPLHRAGWPFVAVFAAATALLAWWWLPFGVVGLLLTLWCAWFFRDPPRVTPTRPGLVISPADGRVQAIVAAVPPAELGLGGEARVRISIFLSLFDVHINRVPADGTVLRTAYRAGRFVNAALDKASEDNERMAVALRLPDGRALAFVQIAGLVARRIICTLRAGQVVLAGERFGLIRFGSRADIYLPAGIAPLVVVGQRTVGGETVLADLYSAEPARLGEIR